jgi:hypothetical protein
MRRSWSKQLNNSYLNFQQDALNRRWSLLAYEPLEINPRFRNIASTSGSLPRKLRYASAGFLVPPAL